MASYDENLDIVTDIVADKSFKYKNIKYDLYSIAHKGDELINYIPEVFDFCDVIPQGSLTYVTTPKDKLVEHYYPKSKIVMYEQVPCFYFNNVKIIVDASKFLEPSNTYLKYYKLQKYTDIINKIPDASIKPEAEEKSNSYRFVYTTQKITKTQVSTSSYSLYTFTLNGYYAVNGWELMLVNSAFDPINSYIFNQEDKQKTLINPEYYELTKKTNKLMQVDDPMLNCTTGNTLKKLAFPGFYINGENSFIRYANELTNDSTQYKFSDNRNGFQYIDTSLLPENSDNLGYEDLTNNKIMLFNGFDNNYQLTDLFRSDNKIDIEYIDLSQGNKRVQTSFKIRPQDKIYVVRRTCANMNYANEHIYTSARYGFYNLGSIEHNLEQGKDFVYTFAFYDEYRDKYEMYQPRICFTGPAWFWDEYPRVGDIMKLNINNSQLSGTYLPDTYFHLEDLNYSTDIGEYKNLFKLQQYNTILTIDSEIQYGNAFYSYKDTTMKRLEFISKNKKIYYPTSSQTSTSITPINIQINGSLWTLTKGILPGFENFISIGKKIDLDENTLSITSAINNLPGGLPNYINLLSAVDLNARLLRAEGLYDMGTLSSYQIQRSDNIKLPLGSSSSQKYDLKFTTTKHGQLSSYLRFGFDSKYEEPSEGYVVFLELHKAN